MEAAIKKPRLLGPPTIENFLATPCETWLLHYGVDELKTIAALPEVKLLPLPKERPEDFCNRIRAHLLRCPNRGLKAKKAIFTGYVLRKLLGSGSFGTVYKAHVEGSMARVALKCIGFDPALHLDKTVGAGYAGLTAEELHEMSAQRYLVHPNILPINNVIFRVSNSDGDEGQLVAFELPLMNRSLKETCKSLPFTTASSDETQHRKEVYTRLRIAFELRCALSFVHANRFMHLDLKPENILLNEHGTVKLADFGIAQSEFGKRHWDVITKYYRPPEIACKKHYGPQADVWSYGIVLIELFFGVAPQQYLKRAKSLPASIAEVFGWSLAGCGVALQKPPLPTELAARILGKTQKQFQAYYTPEIYERMWDYLAGCLAINPADRSMEDRVGFWASTIAPELKCAIPTPPLKAMPAESGEAEWSSAAILKNLQVDSVDDVTRILAGRVWAQLKLSRVLPVVEEELFVWRMATLDVAAKHMNPSMYPIEAWGKRVIGGKLRATIYREIQAIEPRVMVALGNTVWPAFYQRSANGDPLPVITAQSVS